jgi:type IV secretory pathway TraG/TraD family ATPase VirD4
MRRTQVAVLVLMAGVVALAIWNIYPFIAPLIAHHQTKGIVGVILTSLLTSHAQTPLGPYLPWIMIAIALLGYCIISYDLKHRRRTTHGSAHHAGRQEARKYSAPRTTPRRPGRVLQAYTGSRRDEHRLILGKYRGKTISLGEQQQYQHVLLTAPTGAGKSTRVFIPNLLQETGTRSLFVGDLKNELYQKTAGWLAQYMQVWLFGLCCKKGS